MNTKQKNVSIIFFLMFIYFPNTTQLFCAALAALYFSNCASICSSRFKLRFKTSSNFCNDLSQVQPTIKVKQLENPQLVARNACISPLGLSLILLKK